MRLVFELYWPLLLLLLIPALWWIRRNTIVDLNPKQLLVSTLVRSFVLLTLILALMQPILYRMSNSISVVYLLDVSKSVAPGAIQDAIQWIGKTNDAGHPAEARFVAFGANARTVDTLKELSQVPIAAEATAGAVDQSATDIAKAMEAAVQGLVPDHLKRLVVLSDGNSTAGNLAPVLARLRSSQVRVFTRPMQARLAGDVWIENLIVPSSITPEQQFPIDLHVFSQKEVSAEIEIRERDKVLAKKTVNLSNGLNRIAFETSIADNSGTVVLEATAKVAGDPFPDNNVFKYSMAVLGKPRLLYVEGYEASAHYLNDALTVEGFTVDIVAPGAVPATLDKLDPYDAVILSDVDRKLLSDEQMKAITSYVRDLGGGFIMAGGENVYGKDGYTKTPLEEALPVTFDPKQPHTIGLMIVLDRSGSMAGQKMDLAKEATKAPVDVLKDKDRFGVIAFDYNWRWIVEPTRLTNKPAVKEAISRIIAQGETNIYPALREAYLKLKDTDDEVKHIILLSDGRTLPDDFQELLKEISAQKITVSTVAVGNAADKELLANISKWGNGRTYAVDNPQRVPQIFTEETELATLRELPFTPTVKKAVDAFTGINFATAPQLQGYVATKSKETAEVLLEADKDQPLLARWQYGLGKTVMFTSDVKDRWAVDWLTWPEYPKFWSQLVRETMRPQSNDNFDFEARRNGNSAELSINALQTDGQFRNRLETKVRVIAPDQSVTVVDVPQVGPGSYKTRVPLADKGTYLFRAVDAENGGPSRVLPYSYPEEYHFYPPDTNTLRAISSETGGLFQPKGAEIFDPKDEMTAVPTPLWPWLAAGGLILYVFDVLLRRLRLFEKA